MFFGVVHAIEPEPPSKRLPLRDASPPILKEDSEQWFWGGETSEPEEIGKRQIAKAQAVD
jgi:hypothetical protein